MILIVNNTTIGLCRLRKHRSQNNYFESYKKEHIFLIKEILICVNWFIFYEAINLLEHI